MPGERLISALILLVVGPILLLMLLTPWHQTAKDWIDDLRS